MTTHRAALQDDRPVSRAPVLDADSAAWLRALCDTGPERDAAIERLHGLLLRAARSEVARRRTAAEHGSADLDDIAAQAADDALLAVLGKLSCYRGAARFTTWAYKFALLEAAVRMRRRPWIGRELPLEAEGWARLADNGAASPAAHAEACELIDAIRDAIADELTPHQRDVLIALTLNDVPIDVLAERQATTRGALYKTLHDSRRKLHTRLAGDGLVPDRREAT
jgi:RNA polymerase sigma-70 factor, ECF subfamily